MEIATHPLNAVDTILAKMIAAWPGLYPNRWHALRDVASFNEYDGKWDKAGNLVVLEHSKLHSDGDLTNKYNEEDVVKSKARLEKAISANKDARFIEAAKADYADAIVRRDRELSDLTFIVEHAEMLAMSRRGHFPKCLSYDEMSLLDAYPENIAPEWLAAFVEFAEQMIYVSFDEHHYASMAAEYRDRYREDYAKAQQKARDFLTRVKGSDTEKKALVTGEFQAKIDTIIKQAAEAGVIVTATIA